MAEVSAPGAVTIVKYKNAAGHQLAGHLVDAGTQVTVVLCHGYMDHKDGFHNIAMADKFKAQGICSLRFDFAGNGESEGDFDFCAYQREVEDIRASVEYLRQLGKEVMAIVGHSKGGAEVLLYAARYDDVPKVVNISGRFNMVRGITERFGEDIFDRLRRGGQITAPHKDGRTWTLTQQSVQERMETNMGEAACAIRRSRVLTVHGSDDKTIPVADAHEYDDRIQQHTLYIIQGADHNYTNSDHAEQLIAKVVEWVAAT